MTQVSQNLKYVAAGGAILAGTYLLATNTQSLANAAETVANATTSFFATNQTANIPWDVKLAHKIAQNPTDAIASALLVAGLTFSLLISCGICR
jgi:hypothetical protein